MLFSIGLLLSCWGHVWIQWKIAKNEHNVDPRIGVILLIGYAMMVYSLVVYTWDKLP